MRLQFEIFQTNQRLNDGTSRKTCLLDLKLVTCSRFCPPQCLRIGPIWCLCSTSTSRSRACERREKSSSLSWWSGAERRHVWVVRVNHIQSGRLIDKTKSFHVRRRRHDTEAEGLNSLLKLISWRTRRINHQPLPVDGADLFHRRTHANTLRDDDDDDTCAPSLPPSSSVIIEPVRGGLIATGNKFHRQTKKNKSKKHIKKNQKQEHVNITQRFKPSRTESSELCFLSFFLSDSDTHVQKTHETLKFMLKSRGAGSVLTNVRRRERTHAAVRSIHRFSKGDFLKNEKESKTKTNYFLLSNVQEDDRRT